MGKKKEKERAPETGAEESSSSSSKAGAPQDTPAPAPAKRKLTFLDLMERENVTTAAGLAFFLVLALIIFDVVDGGLQQALVWALVPITILALAVNVGYFIDFVRKRRAAAAAAAADAAPKKKSE